MREFGARPNTSLRNSRSPKILEGLAVVVADQLEYVFAVGIRS